MIETSTNPNVDGSEGVRTRRAELANNETGARLGRSSVSNDLPGKVLARVTLTLIDRRGAWSEHDATLRQFCGTGGEGVTWLVWGTRQALLRNTQVSALFDAGVLAGAR